MSLQFDSVVRRYGKQLALDGLTAHIETGDCYGLIGHNGSGKTSAMRIALGLQRADAGRVRVDGFDVREHPREARARMGGLIETPGFHAHLDGEENLRLLARLQGSSRTEARDEARRLLELVGLPRVGSKPVRAYSQGMRQRLGIAQALIGEPAYVLLDEPTNGLDPEGIAEIREVLRRLTRDEGLTVLLSSHQLHEIGDLCNRIGVVRQGKLVVEAETQWLMSNGVSRFEVETRDDARAAEVLARDGIRAVVSERGGLVFDLGARAPGEIARAIVGAGIELVRLGSRPPSLEEIYLRYTRSDAREALPAAHSPKPSTAPAPQAKPTTRLAPPHPIARVFRYELSRMFAKPSFLLLLSLPALFGIAAVLLDQRQAAESAARVARGEIATATDVTGFQSAASALGTGLPLLAILLAGLASQMIAGELSRGTLRNVLVRSQTRIQTVVGKWLAGLCLTLAAYALLAGAALAASSIAFGFRDLAEILPNGQTFPLVQASELWPDLRRALAAPIAPLIGFFSVGFAAGACVSGAAAALSLALGAILVIDLGRGIARGLAVEGGLLSAYLPSPLGDTSYVHYYADRAQGISNSVFQFGVEWFPGMTQDLCVPALWSVAGLVLSAILLSRRPVP